MDWSAAWRRRIRESCVAMLWAAVILINQAARTSGTEYSHKVENISSFLLNVGTWPSEYTTQLQSWDSERHTRVHFLIPGQFAYTLQ